MRLRLRALLNAQSPSPAWADQDLVRECLRGNEEAWSALVDKYKQLVYSIPFKYHAPAEDAADIFQAVWMELHAQLPRLRKADSLRSWLIKVASHQCFHWKRKRQQELARQSGETEPDRLSGDVLSPRVVEELEREQILREATASLPDRCREMIRLLFYQDPPVPYGEVARRLGLAVGSIGFIRGRCLKRLRQSLQDRGF